MGKPTTSKSPRAGKAETSKPVRSTRSENKPESKLDSKSENKESKESNETKKLKKDEGEDTSILHSSVNLSGSGLRQISKIFENGTNEIKDLLSFECDVIYECKVCRNLFRSVANFISHKRIYCTSQYQTSNQLLQLHNKLEEDCSPLEPADAVHPHVVKTKLKNANRIIPRSNLAAVLNSRVNNFSKPVHIRSNRNDFNSNGDHSVMLQSMQGSKAGVFQTYIPNASAGGYSMSMKDQMQELYSAQQEIKTQTIEQGFWEVNGDENFEFTNGISDLDSNNTYTCDRCGLPCTSAKALLRHKKSVHETARTCYLCPCCKGSFPNTWSVHRHLFKVHHKTNEQVRKLRLQIKSKVLQPGEATKGLSDKLKIVNQKITRDEKITDQQRWDLENEEWLDQLGKDVDLLRCGSCGRKFERRAALKAHYQICQKRVVPPVSSTVQYRATPEKEINPPDPRPKTITDNAKLLPVVALTALTPAQIKEKSFVPEKKIGIQVRMDYCKSMGSSTNSERSNRLLGFNNLKSIETITIDDERTIEKPKSCLETLLTEKRNNRSDSGNDSESQDDISVALDFSSDSVGDEDAIKLNMYDILGISSTESRVKKAFDSSLNMDSSNCDEFSNENSAIPNKRKKAFPVKRLLCNVENGLKPGFSSRSEVWSEKSNELDCVFRKENVRVTYTNCKLKSKTESDKVIDLNDPPASICPELVEKLANFYNKTNGICLLCNNKFDPVNILRHITEHGSWVKFRCKWPQCEYGSSTKTALVKHISKDHQSPGKELVTHDFVELISKKDWKFIVAVPANKYRKKPDSLLKSVNKLKERLNGVSKLAESAIEEETSTSIDLKLNEKSQVDVSDEKSDFGEMYVDPDPKAVEPMDIESASSSDIEIVELNSSIDDKDCQVLSVKSCGEDNLLCVGDSNDLARSICHIIGKDDVTSTDKDNVNNSDVDIVDKDNVDTTISTLWTLLKDDVGLVNKEDVDTVYTDNVNQGTDVKVVSNENEPVLESNLEITAEIGDKTPSPKSSNDSSEKESFSKEPSNSCEEEASSKITVDSNEGNNAASNMSSDLNEITPEVSVDFDKNLESPSRSSNVNSEEAFSEGSASLHEGNASQKTSTNLNEEQKKSPKVSTDLTENEVSEVKQVLTDSNIGEASPKESTDLNAEEKISLGEEPRSNETKEPSKMSTDLNEEKLSSTTSTSSSKVEALPEGLTSVSERITLSSVSTRSNVKKALSEVSTDLNEEKPSPMASTVSNKREVLSKMVASVNEKTAFLSVSTRSNVKKALSEVSTDLSEEKASTTSNKEGALFKGLASVNERTAFPSVSTRSNVKKALSEVSTDSSEEKASSTASTISNKGEASSEGLVSMNERLALPSVSTRSNKRKTPSEVSIDLNEEKASSTASKNVAFTEVSTDLNEGIASPQISTDSHENNSSPKISSDSNENKLSLKISADLSEDISSPEIEVISTNLIEENAHNSLDESMCCDSPSVEDGVMNAPYCVDMADVDPSISVIEHSEMEVELDDDHLRAVMMEMIFGGTSNEAASSSTSEFYEQSKNAGGRKRRKLVNAKLNV